MNPWKPVQVIILCRQQTLQQQLLLLINEQRTALLFRLLYYSSIKQTLAGNERQTDNNPQRKKCSVVIEPVSQSGREREMSFSLTVLSDPVPSWPGDFLPEICPKSGYSVFTSPFSLTRSADSVWYLLPIVGAEKFSSFTTHTPKVVTFGIIQIGISSRHFHTDSLSHSLPNLTTKLGFSPEIVSHIHTLD